MPDIIRLELFETTLFNLECNKYLYLYLVTRMKRTGRSCLEQPLRSHTQITVYPTMNDPYLKENEQDSVDSYNVDTLSRNRNKLNSILL